MNTESILKKVRKIEIKSRGLSNDFFSGAYHTAFKGRGMSFSEVREYAPGDDIRSIDWNVTARLRTPYVKVFHEERELTVMLMVDISASSFYGSFALQKAELMAELIAVIAFSAQNNNDKIGVLFFSDKVEKFIPPKKGKSHVLRIIREMLTIQPAHHNHTNIHAALEYLNQVMRRKSIVFLMSDFVGYFAEKSINITARRHDLLGIHLYDAHETKLPQVGLLQMMDSETRQQYWVDTADKSLQSNLQQSFQQNLKKVQDVFSRNDTDLISIATEEDYVKKLHGFFKNRRNAR